MDSYVQFKKSEDRQLLEAYKVKFIKNVECECYIIMQIQYTKNLTPRKFELGTTLS